MKVRTNINNMDAAFTLATNVDVEVTMLRFCSKFGRVWHLNKFELYKKKKGYCLSKSPNPIHIIGMSIHERTIALYLCGISI